MCESQSEKAFNEKLDRSQQISGQVPPVMQQPMPFVPPPKRCFLLRVSVSERITLRQRATLVLQV